MQRQVFNTLTFVRVQCLQAVALHLLATLLSADKSSTVLAEVCHREKVPKALLASVVAHAEGVVMQHSSKAQVRWLSLSTQLGTARSCCSQDSPCCQSVPAALCCSLSCKY